MAEATEKSSLSRKVLALGETELEVYEGGDGPPLVFLHGAEGLDPEAPFLKSLATRFRIVAPSHPGFGGSSMPPWMDSIDDFVHVHLDLLDRLGLERITLVGASLGGWTAAELATKTTSRIARLVLVGPVGIKVGAVDKLDIPDIYAMTQDKVDRLLFHDPVKWRLDPGRHSDDGLLAIARNRETAALVTWEPFMHNPKLRHRLYRIDRPTLILRGASDGLISPEYAAAYAGLIPDARVETIGDAGHQPYLEQPERFVEKIVGFAAP